MTNKLYIANLGKYNEGELVGSWFEFPIDMNEVAVEIGLNAQYEEYAIHDYEMVYPITVNEYSSVNTLNDIVASLDAIDGLYELCEALNSDSKYDVNSWGHLAVNVFSEMEYDADIVDGEWLDDYIKNSDRGWEGIKIFLSRANVNNEYHLLDGYGNVQELHYSDVQNMLHDAIQDAIRLEHGNVA